MATPLTSEKLEAIRSNAQNPEISQAALADQLAISLSSLTRIIGRIRKGTFEKLLEQAKRREAKQDATPIPTIEKPDSDLGRKVLKLYQRGGLTPAEIRDKIGTTDASVYYWLNKFGWKKRTAAEAEAKLVHHAHESDKGEPKWIHNAKHLHDQGMSYREIGEKLGIAATTVSYHLHAKQQYQLAKLEKKEHLNGDAPSDTGINKNIFIGYAFAKVEEYITVLAQRAGFSHNLLRARLAELLGHPSFREPGRD